MKKLGIILLSVLGIAALLAGIWLLLGDSGKIEGIKARDAALVGAEEEETTPYQYVEEDMELLKKYQDYNRDVVGLITIPETVLNHPVVQTPDDEDYYLSKDLDGKYNSHGVPFLSADSKMEGKGGNRVMFGHNIHKLTRDVFADLAGYEELEFYKEHPVIKTVSASGTRHWLIFAYYIVDNADAEPFRYSDVTDFLSKQEFDAYMAEVNKRNWLDVPVECTIEDTFLTLSSCSNELSGSGTNRMVVMAKELYAGEAYEKIVEDARMKESPLLPVRLQK